MCEVSDSIHGNKIGYSHTYVAGVHSLRSPVPAWCIT